MAYTFKQESYEEILSEFNEIIKWLEQCEAPIKPTRINKYRKILNLLIDAHKKGTTQKILDRGDFLKIVYSFYEVAEIRDIWRGLKEKDSKELRTRLKKFVKGPENITDELPKTSSDYPRNIGFELYTASRFAISDFDVTLSPIGDISASYQRSSLYIECKRPNQLNKLKKNIDKAFRQLEKRYKQSNNTAVGLVALSINKLINPKQELLVMNSLDELSNYLRKLVDKFIIDYKDYWQGRKEERTVGTLISLQVPCIIKNKNLLTIGRQIGVNPTTIPGTKAHNLIMNITNRLNKGTYLL